MKNDNNKSEKKIKKSDKKDSKLKIKIWEIFGFTFVVLVFGMVLFGFYYFLRSDKKDLVLNNKSYLTYDGGSLNINEALEKYEEVSFDTFIEKLNYQLVQDELDDDDLDDVDDKVEEEIEELRKYYTSDEDLNNAINMYTGFNDLDEYREKDIMKRKSYEVYALKYCDSNDIEEDLCNKYLNYYTTKAIYELAKEKNLKFKVSSSKEQYEDYLEKIEKSIDDMKEEMDKAEKDYSNIISVSYDELEELINNKESFIGVITQTGCSHCENFLPILNEALVDDEMVAIQINITDYSQEEKQKIGELIDFEGTPATFFFKKGKLSGKIYEGDNFSVDEVKELIKKANL